MKRLKLGSIKPFVTKFILFGLLIANFPSKGIGQKAEAFPISETSPQIINKENFNKQNNGKKVSESLVFRNQENSMNFGSDDRSKSINDNRGRGPKKPKGKGKDNDSEESEERAIPTQFEIAAQPGVKIFVDSNSWYSVSANELTNAGFDVNADSANWRLITNGQEIPFMVNPDGSIKFYGVGQDNLSTDSSVYYLFDGNITGLRISRLQPSPIGQTPDVENFPVKVERKDKVYYIPSLLNGEVENWFASFVVSTSSNVDINVDNLASVGQVSLEIKLQGHTNTDHLVNVKINGNDVGMISFSNKDYHQETFNIPLAQVNEGNNQITLQAFGAGTDFSFLDSVALTFPRNYTPMDNKLHFSVPAGQTVSVGGFSGQTIDLFEIEENMAVNQSIVQPILENQTYGFRLAATSNDREFYAMSGSQTSAPKKVEQNVPSSWNNSSNQADFVIISPSILSSKAQDLANRRISQGLNTKVVLTEDIGDEFGFGVVTPQAIRDFLENATTNWNRKPDYVLLFGDSSFDMRNYLGGEDRNLVPTKLIETFDMETASDGWLVDFDDDGVENISIGRIPVGNLAEADKMFNKIVRYETQNLNDPKSALLVADTYFEILNGALQDLLPTDVDSTKIERWAMTDSEMRQEILDETNASPTFISYLGHGTTKVWSTGNLFGVSQAVNLTNEKLSFYMLMTCLNGFTHHADYSSLGETLVMADNGAIAVWTSSGSTYASGQIAMGQEVINSIFPTGNQRNRIGDVVRNAKQTSADWDARRTWQLIGDPTMVIE